MSEGDGWRGSRATNTQTKNLDMMDNYVVLNNGIVAKSSCLWHVKEGVKHPSVCWVPGLEWWWLWKRKKHPCWSLPSSSIFQVCNSTQCLLQPSSVSLYCALIFSPISVPCTQGAVLVRMSHVGSAAAVQTYHFFQHLQEAEHRAWSGLPVLANTSKDTAATSVLSSMWIMMPL